MESEKHLTFSRESQPNDNNSFDRCIIMSFDNNSLVSSPTLSLGSPFGSPSRQYGITERGPDPKDPELDRRLLQRLLDPEKRGRSFSEFLKKDVQFFGEQRQTSSKEAFRRRTQVINRNRRLLKLARSKPEWITRYCVSLGILDTSNPHHRSTLTEFFEIPDEVFQSPTLKSPPPSCPTPPRKSTDWPTDESERLDLDKVPQFNIDMVRSLEDEFCIPAGLKVWNNKPCSVSLDFDEVNNNPSGVIPRLTPNEKEGDVLVDTMDIRIGVVDMKDIVGDRSRHFYQGRLKQDKKSFYIFTPCHPDCMTNSKIQDSYYSMVKDEDQGKATSKKQTVAIEQKKEESTIECRLLEFHFPPGIKGSTKYFNNGEEKSQLKRRLNTCLPEYSYHDAGATKKFKQMNKEVWFKIPIEGTDARTSKPTEKAAPDDAAAALAGTLSGLSL